LCWPRFIILFFYVTTLFSYSLLAKNEECRMQMASPGGYADYMGGTDMFIPGNPGGRQVVRIFSTWAYPGGRCCWSMLMPTLAGCWQ